MDMNGATAAALLGIWATFALDVFSAMNSSPQTTEINAKARADTLMKWVYLGDAVAVGGGLAATVISRKAWPLVGALLVTLLMHMLYVHARKTGLRSNEPGTESY